MRCVSVWSVALDLKGPQFVQEPPLRLEFSNSSGGRLECSAHGSPPPELAWSLEDDTPVEEIPNLRLVHQNGSLVFPPFPAEHYRHDVHTALYRCKAQNPVGSILPRRPGGIVWNGEHFLLLYVGKDETSPLSVLGAVFHRVRLQKAQQKPQDFLACVLSSPVKCRVDFVQPHGLYAGGN
ncbi:hypothetical protein Cfor_07942 [Coptotermes formosanus]|uniref:Ig-like domain-containing protein n=1 Tax=Coptotermes formosanus TaxID=36987 RepID=A0A6L2PFC1_COPFO|nr:hypothetical protein Cfor_07942 [Coptotermes formosanus]